VQKRVYARERAIADAPPVVAKAMAGLVGARRSLGESGRRSGIAANSACVDVDPALLDPGVYYVPIYDPYG
jgi:hypothetical protein